jgi:lipoprotein-anchoring transpeptidase ErfK/SrfK
VVTVGGRTLSFTPRELGVTDDTEAAVDSAFEQALTGSWTDRAWDRLRGETSSPSADVTVTAADLAPLEARAAETAAALAVPARDATVQLVGGKPAWTPSSPGQQVDAAAVVAALEDGLADGTPRDVPLQAVAPEVGDDAFGTVLVVRTGTNVLEVYKGQRLVRTFGVATGSPEFATPTGRTSVTLKRYRPTWVNPGSDWGKSMPAKIGPGPDNPLGTRALNLGFPNIRIHGTPAASSIGYSVSHGCIRMRMPDVEALYDMVPQGATVFIVRGGPPRLPARAAAPVDTATAAAADGG